MRLVSTCQRKRQQKKPLEFAYAFRSFIGYLEGSGKAAHTIKNYRGDLLSFQHFLQKGLGSVPVSLSKVTRQDLEKYHDYLKAEGLKNNTRRRRILTIRRLLRYLTQRNRIAIDVGRKLPAPHKIERIPLTVPWEELIDAIRALPSDTLILARNQALLWTLAETGCLVSEAARLRFEQWSALQGVTAGPASLSLSGKSLRNLPVSQELYSLIKSLEQRSDPKNPWLFLGFNKFGSLGSPITPRGIELLVKAYAERLGFPELTPRTFRHSVVLHWHLSGLSREQIRTRLGLKTDYAFRVYDPIFKSSSTATSTSETIRTES